MLVFLLYSNFGQIGYSQVVHTGVIWVVPKRTDAYPVNGNRTGNSGLNLGFEDFHVIEYVFIDSLYFYGMFDVYGNQLKKPVYQIRLQEEYAHWEISMLELLHDCYPGFFEDFAYPYYNPYSNGQTITTDNGRILLEFENYYFDPTLYPRSTTKSYNKPMNLILKKYDIKSYQYVPIIYDGDTVARWIDIKCHYQDALPLYNDLLKIHHLYEYISMTGSYIFLEQSNPCGIYSGLSTPEEPSLTIFPNPANDEITISGVTPESVMMYDVMGKLVLSEFDTETNKIDIKKLPNGLYIIKIITADGKLFTNKIVKQ